jgi:peptide/nickel transport system substrate-binding protein
VIVESVSSFDTTTTGATRPHAGAKSRAIWTLSAVAILDLVHRGLVRTSADGAPAPDLAESWDVSNGGKTITFHLRRNVRWHDGRPFTSADVLFTFQTLISSNTRTAFSSDYLLV